jgi:hypothetical protein
LILILQADGDNHYKTSHRKCCWII